MKNNTMSRIIMALLLSSSAQLFSAEDSHRKEDYWKATEYHQNSSSQKDAAKDLLQFISLKEDDTVLDVGCGDGKITAELSAKLSNGSITGVDISPTMIDFAKSTFPKERFANLTFVLQDAQEIDYSEEFSAIVSFTALQWVQSHEAFLLRANKSLKPKGLLAVTMPMGLPTCLEQAVNEKIASPEWSSYFQKFSTGWNFIEATSYAKLLQDHGFRAERLAVVIQKDVFPSRALFENFVVQWFPYLRPLPEHLKKIFLTQVIDRFLELESPFPNGEVHFTIHRLEVVANKL